MTPAIWRLVLYKNQIGFFLFISGAIYMSGSGHIEGCIISWNDYKLTDLFTYFIPCDFFTSTLDNGLSDSNSPQVSWTLLSILVDFNNAVDGLGSSFDFQLFQTAFQSFGDWNSRQLQLVSLPLSWFTASFLFAGQVQLLVSLFLSLIFILWSARTLLLLIF